MKIIAIAAIDPMGAIGKDGKLLFINKDDKRFFYEITQGHTVLMGRKTYEEIGKPLKNRNNVILSKSVLNVQGADVFSDLKTALNHCEKSGAEKLFIIGGAEIYEQTLPLWSELYLTVFEKAAKGADAFFPQWYSFDWDRDYAFVPNVKSNEFSIYHYIKKY